MEALRYVMGTLLHVRVEAVDSVSEQDIIDHILREIQDHEARLSRFRPESEVARLNRGLICWEALSPETRQVLEAAVRFRHATGGAFDPEACGSWDLGAFAKGFSMDDALSFAGVTKRRSIRRCDIRMNFGGQLVFWKSRWDQPENVAIAGLPIEFEVASNGSISSSGVEERGFHIIDPATRQPVACRRLVTVIAPSAAAADAWSTALFVLGPERGLPLIGECAGLQALIAEPEGIEFFFHTTPGWPGSIPASRRKAA